MRKLGGKSNTELVSGLKAFGEVEATTVADILLYLEEVQFRKLDLEMGHSSLYKFCRDELGYSKNQAYPRFRAVQALRILSSLENDLRAGRVCVTSLMQAEVALRGEDTRRKEAGLAPLTKNEKIVVLNEIGKGADAKKFLAERFPELKKPRDGAKPIGKGLTLIEFTATDEEIKDFERLKELLAHKNFNGEWGALFNELAQIALDKLAPERKAKKQAQPAQAREHRAAKQAAPPEPVEEQLDFVSKRKYISIHTRRAAHERADYQCQFVDPATGRRCSSRHGLQLDQIQPLSLGGSNDIANLRILCGAHNRFAAWQAGVSPKDWRSRFSMDPPK